MNKDSIIDIIPFAIWDERLDAFATTPDKRMHLNKLIIAADLSSRDGVSMLCWWLGNTAQVSADLLARGIAIRLNMSGQEPEPAWDDLPLINP